MSTHMTSQLRGVALLVIDEVSKVSRQMLAQITQRLQEWRKLEGAPAGSDLPFGGVGVLLAGNFGQLPPVKLPVTHTLLQLQ